MHSRENRIFACAKAIAQQQHAAESWLAHERAKLLSRWMHMLNID